MNLICSWAFFLSHPLQHLSFKSFNSRLLRRCTQVVVFVLMMGSIHSCIGLKPATSSSSGKLLETFFTGENGTQYFIKPLLLKNDNKEFVLLDITFRHRDVIADSALIRLSIYSYELLKNFAVIKFGNGSSQFSINQTELMFTERTKHHLHSRFSLKMPLQDLRKLFTQSNWQITITLDQQELQFRASSKTKRKISELNYSVFSIL